MLERSSTTPDEQEEEATTTPPRRRSAAAALAAQAAAPRRTRSTERAITGGPTTVTRARAPLAAAPPPPAAAPPPAVPPPRAGRSRTGTMPRPTQTGQMPRPGVTGQMPRPVVPVEAEPPAALDADFDIPLAPMRPSRPSPNPTTAAIASSSASSAPSVRSRRPPGATIPPRSSAAAGPVDGPPPGRLTEAMITQNQMVERYLTGQLSQKWTQEFERYCREHPRFLRDTGVHKRLQAGMDLLVATGAAAPAGRLSRFHQLHIGWLLTSVVVLGGSLWATITWSSSLSDQLALLRRQANNRTLPLATSEREIRLLPSRDGIMTSPAIVIANRAAQMLDFHIDETRSPYKIFRVTIDRMDQGRVQVISGLQKDGEGHLLINLNSAALGPGNYQLTIEGFTPKGDAEPDSWVTIGIAPVK